MFVIIYPQNFHTYTVSISDEHRVRTNLTLCVCVCVFTCQQSADRQVYGHLVLRHLVPECLHTVAGQTQADWLLAVWKAAVTVTERAQTLPVGLDQHALLIHAEKHTHYVYTHTHTHIDIYIYIYISHTLFSVMGFILFCVVFQHVTACVLVSVCCVQGSHSFLEIIFQDFSRDGLTGMIDRDHAIQ